MCVCGLYYLTIFENIMYHILVNKPNNHISLCDNY